MKIINSVNDNTVQQACAIVEKYYHSIDFYDSIKDEKFNGIKTINSITGASVYWDKLLFISVVYVKPYKTWSPWSRVIGYAKGNTIFVNTRKLDLPLKDRVENARHEIFHREGFSHNGNRVTAHNLQTVPFKGASLFVKYLERIGVLN